MSIDYARIREENVRKYGTEVSQYGRNLLADLYKERDHFVFELLQNAEDAYRRQPNETRSGVRFRAEDAILEFRHFGKPFDDADVRGVCGIAAGNKGESDIGKFGIGFKSVFSVTDSPQIHSGKAAFEIADYVLPHEVASIERGADETVIRLPLKDSADSPGRLFESLRRHGAESLLFLSHIDSISWTDPEDGEVVVHRSCNRIDPSVSRITLTRTENDDEVESTEWVLVSREAHNQAGNRVGQFQLGFRLAESEESERIQRLAQSPISVVFPTSVQSQLGFLVQAPFNTTPSRDNLRSGSNWNDFCFEQLSELMIEALEWFKSNSMLQSEVFDVLPIVPGDVEKTPFIRPMHEALVAACQSEQLIPTDGGGHEVSGSLRLGRSADLRSLLDPGQLAAIVGSKDPIRWASGHITLDRLPRVRRFLIDVLGVDEMTSDTAFRSMDKSFLSEQPDIWLRSLYEFLGAVPGLRESSKRRQILRVESGELVSPFSGELPNAVLPSDGLVTKQTIRASTCDSEKSLDFLRSIGLESRQLVDEAIEVLETKYSEVPMAHDDESYVEDVELFLKAARTDSRTKLDQLHTALSAAQWVRVLEFPESAPELKRPGNCYGPTKNLTDIFGQVPGVFVVDGTIGELRGSEARNLLRASGVAMGLRVIPDSSRFDEEGFRGSLRADSPQPRTTGYTDKVMDRDIEGLAGWLETIGKLDAHERTESAAALWKELSTMSRDNRAAFQGLYTWTNYGSYSAKFDSVFLEQLREREWVPDSHGELRRPDEIEFEETEFDDDPFLTEKIAFKPSSLGELAEQAGIEPEAIGLLKRLNITTLVELEKLIGPSVDLLPPADGDAPLGPDPGEDDDPGAGEGESGNDIEFPKLPDVVDGPPEPGEGPLRPPGEVDPPKGGDTIDEPEGEPEDPGPDVPPGPGGKGGSPGTSPKPPKPRTFVSYIAADQDGPPDPDQLSHEERMSLEAEAIEFILQREPDWERTRMNNPGFDLKMSSKPGQSERFCEVKAMRGTLDDRPVTLSKRQFETAIDKGERFWLYVVEMADSDEPCLVAIQDPAGKAQYFTFDEGWRNASV